MSKTIFTIASQRQIVGKLLDKWARKTQSSTVDPSNKSSEDLLRDLVAMPTVTGDYAACHDAFDYLERFFAGYGLHVERREWNGVESLIATTRHTKTPTVCLSGHIDVVPGDEELFQIREADGRYYGRGTLDMKGGIAAFMGAIQRLPGDIQDYDLAVMITSDEEVSGFDGAQRLAEEGWRPKVMIIPDGTPGWTLERVAKGIWHVTVEAKGQSAHGSRPWDGDNAIDKLMAFLPKVRALFPRHMAPDTSTCSIGIIQGGETINQIPASASASLDIRFMTAHDQARITRQLYAIAKKAGITVTTEVEADIAENDPENPYLKLYAETTEHIIGRPVEWVVAKAGNDGRYFIKHGVPCAITFPTGGGHHSSSEYIDKEGFFQLQDIIAKYIQQVAVRPKTTTRKKAVLAA